MPRESGSVARNKWRRSGSWNKRCASSKISEGRSKMGPETEIGGTKKPQNAPGAIPAGATTTVWPDGAQGAAQIPAELVAKKVKAAASKTEVAMPELGFGPIVMGVVLGIVF